MGGFVGFRLSRKGHDKDIEADLKRFSDQSKRVREAYRLAMAVERGEYVAVGTLGVSVERGDYVAISKPVKPAEPLTWAFPKEPTVREKAPTDKKDVKKNMLGGF